jgi:predicted RNase H-like nuclease
VSVTVVGVDVASDPANVGLALGDFADGVVTVEAAVMGSPRQRPEEVLVEWLGDRRGPVLLALDAPLGWPAPLAAALTGHQAGDPLPGAANMLFRRETDRVIKQAVGKQSLDVGADRIARTAHAALQLAHGVAARLGRPVQAAWSPRISGLRMIEVYPAATLAAHRIPATGYKAAGGAAARCGIEQALHERLRLSVPVPALAERADGLDAVLCLLAAQDFLNGHCIPAPRDVAVRKEGWMWVRRPEGELADQGTTSMAKRRKG